MNQYYLAFIPPLDQVPCVLYVSAPDPVATPQGIVPSNGGIYAIQAPGPDPVIYTVEDLVPTPAPLTAYFVSTQDPSGNVTIEVRNPTADNPQLDYGMDLPTPTFGNYTVYCKRPVQFLIRNLPSSPAQQGPPAPPPPTPSPPGVAVDLTNITWNNWYSGVPATLQWSTGYPLNLPVDYVATPFASLSGYSGIRFSLEVTGPQDAIIPEPPRPGASPDIGPCTARPWFGTTDQSFAHLRWWSAPHLTLEPGLWTMDVSFDPSNWSTVDGKFATTDPTTFASLLASPSNIGWTCGGQDFYGHGAYAPTGNAGLYLRAYQLLQ